MSSMRRLAQQVLHASVHVRRVIHLRYKASCHAGLNDEQKYQSTGLVETLHRLGSVRHALYSVLCTYVAVVMIDERGGPEMVRGSV